MHTPWTYTQISKHIANKFLKTWQTGTRDKVCFKMALSLERFYFALNPDAERTLLAEHALSSYVGVLGEADVVCTR